MEKQILLLGNPALYGESQPVQKEELPQVAGIVQDLHDTIVAFQKKHGVGRAIAAPQIGAFRRIIYMYIDGKRTVFINPTLSFPSDEMMEVMDDCMSFPGLYVRLQRYKRCAIAYKDIDWKDQRMELAGDLSELLQHEYDHLDGILATMRAKSPKDYYFEGWNQ